uniref:Uncharacterized protein n=1 Tax=Leersia perrieri TaxID=77586 RepID=A0A0D9VXV5_9ORYZ
MAGGLQRPPPPASGADSPGSGGLQKGWIAENRAGLPIPELGLGGSRWLCPSLHTIYAIRASDYAMEGMYDGMQKQRSDHSKQGEEDAPVVGASAVRCGLPRMSGSAVLLHHVLASPTRLCL